MACLALSALCALALFLAVGAEGVKLPLVVSVVAGIEWLFFAGAEWLDGRAAGLSSRLTAFENYYTVLPVLLLMAFEAYLIFRCAAILIERA